MSATVLLVHESEELELPSPAPEETWREERIQTRCESAAGVVVVHDAGRVRRSRRVRFPDLTDGEWQNLRAFFHNRAAARETFRFGDATVRFAAPAIEAERLGPGHWDATVELEHVEGVPEE